MRTRGPGLIPFHSLRTASVSAFAICCIAAFADELSQQTRAWTILHESVDNTRAEVRQDAAVALGSMMGSKEALQILEKLLAEDKDPDVRLTAAAALGTLKSRQAIPALKKAMDDDDAGVSFTAIKALWDMGDLSGRDALEDVLGRSRSTAERGMQAQIRSMTKKARSPSQLAQMGINGASGALLGPFSIGVTAAMNILKDSGAPGRALAAVTLAEHCDASLKTVFEEDLVSEGNWGVKTAIARGLGKCGDKNSIPVLAAYLVDSRNSLKTMAAAAIIRLSAVPPRAARKSAAAPVKNRKKP